MRLRLRIWLALLLLVAALYAGDALQIGIGSPVPVWTGDAGATVTTLAMDAQNEKIGTVFQAPAAITVTTLGFRCHAQTGTPAADSYKISLQGVDTSGLPDGTVLGGVSPASNTFTPNCTAPPEWVWVTLDNSYTTSRGETLAFVFERVAATDAGNYVTATQGLNGTTVGQRMIKPYSLSHNATSWTKSSTLIPTWGYQSASATYGKPFVSYSTVSPFSTAEAGMLFSLDTNWCSTAQVVGVRMMGSIGDAARTVWLTLYATPTGTPSILQQTSYDSDATGGTGGTVRYIEIYFDTTNLSSLTCGTTYAIGLNTQHASSSGMGFSYWNVGTASDWQAWPGSTKFWYANRTLTDTPPSGNDTTAFTETTTARPLMDLIIADFTQPAGGGASSHVFIQ